MSTEQQSTELVKVVEESGLEAQTGNYLKEKFLPFFEQAEEWRKKAQALVVTDATQVREMKMAREARLALKEIRVNANKARIALKEDSIRYGKAVQGVYNVIEYLIAPIEKHLEEQEKFVEIQEAKRKAELKAAREIEIESYKEFIPYGIDLGSMGDEDYAKLLNGAKLQLQAKIEAEAKAEQDRIAKEKEAEEERERLRIENEKLKKEADEREEKAAKERAKALAEKKKADELAKKQRDEFEAKQKKDAEEKAKLQAELDAKEKAHAEELARIEAENKTKAEEDEKVVEKANLQGEMQELNEIIKQLNEASEYGEGYPSSINEVENEKIQEILKSLGKISLVDKGLYLNDHRHYQESISVYEIEINNEKRYLGVNGISLVFSEMSSIEDCYQKLEFFEMSKVQTVTYVKKGATNE